MLRWLDARWVRHVEALPPAPKIGIDPVRADELEAVSLSAMSDPRSSIERIQELIDRDPEDAFPEFILAGALTELGEFRQALLALRRGNERRRSRIYTRTWPAVGVTRSWEAVSPIRRKADALFAYDPAAVDTIEAAALKIAFSDPTTRLAYLIAAATLQRLCSISMQSALHARDRAAIRVAEQRAQRHRQWTAAVFAAVRKDMLFLKWGNAAFCRVAQVSKQELDLYESGSLSNPAAAERIERIGELCYRNELAKQGAIARKAREAERQFREYSLK